MADGRWLIEWMRTGDGEWWCTGPLPANVGFVVIGSGKFRTPAVVECDRTKPEEKPYFRAHMMGPPKEILKDYDDSFWERWYLPPGVHPLDVAEKVENESKFHTDKCGWNGKGDDDGEHGTIQPDGQDGSPDKAG